MTETMNADIKGIVFKLEDEEYVVPVQQVLSIEKVLYITRVPRVSHYVKGVINLRGVVTPIVDLRTRFGLPQVKFSENTRIIIVSYKDKEDVGLIVDVANDVVDIPHAAIEPPPEVVEAIEVDFIHGVAKMGKRLLILLDLDRVLSSVL